MTRDKASSKHKTPSRFERILGAGPGPGMELRPASGKFVELHVFYVPEDQWNVKLNKVPVGAVDSFISAGFIRVDPEVTLRSLRTQLAVPVGAGRSVHGYCFLKCVGHSLALVKGQQEKEVKVKTFAPPYAPQPELYLLPSVDGDSSVCSRSLTLDTSSSSPDHHTDPPPNKCSLPTGTKGPLKLPHITHPLPPPTPGLEEEQSCSSSEEHDEDEEVFSNKRQWMKHEHRGNTSQERAPPPGWVKVCEGLQQREADLTQAKGGARSRRTRQVHGRRGSGGAESQEDRDSGFSFSDRFRKDTDTLKSNEMMDKDQTSECAAVVPGSDRYSCPPAGGHVVTAAGAPALKTDREELIEEIKLVREERKDLERMRQELLRKGKDLLAQNRHRRNQARDGWKKKYFETKKATAPLEDDLRHLRQELETFYTKLLHQLHARENKGKPKGLGRRSVRNELIIDIMTESHEIDNLKRKVEDAAMKLLTEVKLRTQAASELRALRAELAQKKSQAAQPRPAVGWTLTRDKPRAPNT